MTLKEKSATYLRNVVFGVEDSLVSTVGLLSGVAIAGLPRSTILLTGVVLIFVEAFSMATGSYLSEASVDEYMDRNRSKGHSPILGGLVMFFSYFVSGFIPLAPYLFWPAETAFGISIGFSLVALFILGAGSGKVSSGRPFKVGIRMFLLGGIAILVGVTVGSFMGKF